MEMENEWVCVRVKFEGALRMSLLVEILNINLGVVFLLFLFLFLLS